MTRHLVARARRVMQLQAQVDAGPADEALAKRDERIIDAELRAAAALLRIALADFKADTYGSEQRAAQARAEMARSVLGTGRAIGERVNELAKLTEEMGDNWPARMAALRVKRRQFAVAVQAKLSELQRAAECSEKGGCSSGSGLNSARFGSLVADSEASPPFAAPTLLRW